MTRLKCANTGEWINLNQEINKSGEGRIYKTSKSGFLAKIYHSITPEQIDKIQVMVKNPPADPTRAQNHVSIAWPQCMLEDSYGKKLGFLMPGVRDGQTLINIYNPKRREKNAPGFNWLYLHTTASNLASIVREVHAKNYVIGDLKPDNLLVTRNAYVSIIDTDSFQIIDSRTNKIYRCPVVSGEYTPPEMFSKDPQIIIRSEYQDRFGLAVIIWHLLFGYHPFSGEWIGSGNPPDIDRRIEQGYWMYGSNSKVRPSNYSMPMNIIHPELQRLFHKCFNDGYKKPDARPSAADWRTALEVAIQELTQCSVDRGHYYAKSYHKCYWCERKRSIGYDLFATPPGMLQPNLSTRPKATFSIPQLSIPQPFSPPTAPKVPFSVPQISSLLQGHSWFTTQQATTARPVKPAKIIDKLKALIRYGAGISIVLIVGAIALPSFLNQAGKAKQAEAKQYVASMNKAQQSLFAENTSFASKISDLGLGIKAETNNYNYSISKLLNNSVVVAIAKPKQSGLKGYVGIVLASNTNMKLPGVTTYALFCEQSQASTALPDLSTVVSKKNDGGHNVSCPAGYAQWNSNQSLTPKLSPQEVVKKYYQLAPSNREGAEALLSDAYKNWYKQNKGDNTAASFWDTINKVEVYQVANLFQSENHSKLKVWLKYLTKNGGEPCESQEIEVILDRSKAQWLIDRTDNIEQKPDCGR